MAKKTRAQITTEINNLLADNSNNEITAQDLRNILSYIVESLYNLTDDDNTEVAGFTAAVSANTDVAANSSARHTHTQQAAISDANTNGVGIIDESDGNISGNLVIDTGDQTTNDNNACIAKAININNNDISDLTSSVNSILSALRAYGLLTT